MKRYTRRTMWTDCTKRGKRSCRDLTIVERCVKEEQNSPGLYDINSEEKLIRGVAVADAINTEDTETSGEIKK